MTTVAYGQQVPDGRQWCGVGGQARHSHLFSIGNHRQSNWSLKNSACLLANVCVSVSLYVTDCSLNGLRILVLSLKE